MTDYTRLVYLWSRRQAAIALKLYPDGVQAWGMAFAAEWNKNRDALCVDFGIKPDDFNYSLAWPTMESMT